MELLVRYAEALGAERFVDTNNVAGVPGRPIRFCRTTTRTSGDRANGDAIFSFFDLDSDELVEVPQALVQTCHLQGGADPDNWETLGTKPEVFKIYKDREAFAANHGVKILKTCTPYLAGNVPARGEHCAWMESSAVVYCNSVLGARTNTEGRESTSAAMLTGKIPDWGSTETETATARTASTSSVPVESVMDWGMLGYFVGDVVQERIPVLTGRLRQPDLDPPQALRRGGGSSGGVEMYHIVGVTPEARDARGGRSGRNAPVETFTYGRGGAAPDLRSAERQRAAIPTVDYVMLGCPHAALEQIERSVPAARRADESAGTARSGSSRRARCRSRPMRAATRRSIADAGGVLMTDTCSAFAQAIPPGTKVAALDSAKQAHYLPAIMDIQAWFGSTADCINAAITGKWNPEPL